MDIDVATDEESGWVAEDESIVVVSSVGLVMVVVDRDEDVDGDN